MVSRTAIIILNYRNFQDTINCIESIVVYTPINEITIFVVDNDSGNNSLDEIHEFFRHRFLVTFFSEEKIFTSENIVLIQNTKNQGYASGNNVGLKIASDLGFKYLMVLNNDTLFVQSVINDLKSVIDRFDDALCVGPVLLKKGGEGIDYNCAKRRPSLLDIFRFSFFGSFLKTEDWKRSYYYLKNGKICSEPYDVGIISGSCMFFNAKKLKNINFFDESTFLYYEEAILSEKARCNGYKMYINPTKSVIHLGAKSTRKEKSSYFLLNAEYNSLKIYLRKYRMLSKLSTFALTSSYYIYKELYRVMKE